MRVSVDKDDPGYSPCVIGTEVLLDGVKLSYCFTADDEQGIAIVALADENGNVVVDRATDEVCRTTLLGVVTIIPPNHAKALPPQA